MTKRFRKALTSVALAVTLPSIALVSEAEASSSSITIGDLTGSDAISSSLSARDLLGVDQGTSSQAHAQPSSRLQADNLGLTAASPVVESAPPVNFSELHADATSSVVAQGFTVPVDETFAPLTDEELRDLLLINPDFVPGAPKPAPASGFLTPSAYGADWGDAFVGFAYVTQGDNDFKDDGSISTGMGFGNAVDNVGVEVSVGIISIDGFGDDGTIGVKLHKVFPQADNLAVAVGWSNAIKWGAAGNSEDTFYGVVTKRFDLQPAEQNTLPLTASLGVGTGAFRSTGAIAANDNTPNVFGSLGLRVIPEVSIVSGWTGSALGLGVSAAPFDFPLVITAGVSDVTGNTTNGARFNASAGYSFSF